MSKSVTGAVGITPGVTAILFPRPERATGTETKTKGTLSPVPPVNTSKEQMAPLPTPANVYEDHSLQYITIDNAIQGILRHGRGCFLAKTDIESAFRLIPLKPSDYELFGMFWDGKYYYDKVLPFGLRSAAFLFNMLSDAVEWILLNKCYISFVCHILDDFLIIEPTSPSPSPPPPHTHSQACQVSLSSMLLTFSNLAIPVAINKTLGPENVLEFMGIILD